VPLPVHGDGTQSRDFTYVGTLTSVLAEAIRGRVTSADPVNLAFGTRITLLDVIDQLETILGHPLERNHTQTRVGDVPHSQADNSRLRALFPEIEPIAFTDGLRATVEWMKSVHA
jgi:UDP-glucose 4-epimerase